MKNRHELLVSVPEGAIIVDIQKKGKEIIVTYEFPETMEMIYESDKNKFNKLFPIVEASKLSLEDKFMKHTTYGRNQKDLKKSLEQIIEEGMSDFRCQAMDASENEGEILFFEEGCEPAVNHSAEWWEEKAIKIMPKKNSRLGSKKRYDAFLGVLIKYLVDEKKYTVYEAWRAVCDDSKFLGHYYNSPNAKKQKEPTGSRWVGCWADLANTCKIIKEDENYVLVSGTYREDSTRCTLVDCADIEYADEEYSLSVGWIVMDV